MFPYLIPKLHAYPKTMEKTSSTFKNDGWKIVESVVFIFISASYADSAESCHSASHLGLHCLSKVPGDMTFQYTKD